MQVPHIPVLFSQTIAAFAGLEDGYVLDWTLGYGGHSEGILTANPRLKLIACDRDAEAIEFSRERLSKFNDRVEIHKAKFSEILKILPEQKLRAVRGILADIGVSSLQLNKNCRGFSTKSDALDMRMDAGAALDAAYVVNRYSQAELARIFREYAELTNANAIASKIAAARANAPLTSAKALANLIGTKPAKGRSISLAALAFQAIRIEVNNELGELKGLLDLIEQKSRDLILTNANVAIISFHSLEDRIVKTRFKQWERSCICPSGVMRCECGGDHSLGKILTKSPLTADAQELAQNSRAASAKLRIFRLK
ncbi:16S rRNA (cytosine(1402)-N(4))-methyltransferase RsmH [uncultured Campylobacter sp.]|uniref:16S rRNA (cytosine(1402)-N(4))-methyltransferase RsmH n=1 Tax=uncultured Campylobacter sp. TaxID=218934 RepID=UPI00262B712D|nr:16S rRNA (cytosine(1402)-N(4))-methyltransferase RsmH [uncultured Campylobacter sp.]